MFSVVIPLYNKELSIQNTIQSILDQTYQNFEIIVIDDGSTDDSAERVNKIEDHRIRMIQQKNQGVSVARNHGIKIAKNEWIALLDGDDLWEVNHLQEICEMMNEFPNGKIYVTSFDFSDGRKVFKHQRQKKSFKIDNYFKEAVKENLIWTSVVVIHISCFNKVGGFNNTLTNGEDLELWARLAREFIIIKSCIITAIYRVEAENRAALNREIEKTHVFHFKLSSVSNDDEKKYYEYLILSRLYSYSRIMDLKNFFKLKNRHSEISWNDCFLFFLNNIKKKINSN